MPGQFCIKMKQLITVVLILALSQSLFISSNAFPRDNIRNNLKNHEMVNGLKEKLKRHISKDELKSLRAQFEHIENSKGLEPFIQKLRNGNDDPTVNYTFDIKLRSRQETKV